LAMLKRDPYQSWQDSTNFGQGPVGVVVVPWSMDHGWHY
jgi:hypothetical protein